PAEVLARAPTLLGARTCRRRKLPQDRSLMSDGLDDVAGAGLALRPDHGGTLGDAPERLAQIASAAEKRACEGPFVDVLVLVRRRENFALVDVIDAERLQDLSLDEMSDPRLGHHR